MPQKGYAANVSLACLKGRLKVLSGVFSRVTTSGLFVPNFDGLRFIAIALVVLFHAFQEGQTAFAPQAPAVVLSRLVSVGWVGVTLFFAISGFVLALPFANHYLNGARAVALPQYYLRRVTRLEPPYMICLLAYFGIKAFILKQAGLLPHLLASMTYTHNVIYSDVSTIQRGGLVARDPRCSSTFSPRCWHRFSEFPGHYCAGGRFCSPW